MDDMHTKDFETVDRRRIDMPNLSYDDNEYDQIYQM